MKKTKRTLAIILALIMVLSVSVFAAWNQYQGNDNHNGQITDATPPTTNSISIATPSLNKSGTGWSGVDTTPVMETVDGVTYSYVTYNGVSKGTQLSKINCNTGTAVWHSTISSTKNANQLSTPYLDTTNGIVYVAATNYYWYIQNKEFVDNDIWTLNNGATITVGTSDSTSYVTIPNGGSISQSFTNTTSGTISTQLTSAMKLATSGTSATVTYTLKKPDNSTVQLASETVDSDTDWHYIEITGTSYVSATGDYTLTVSVTGATVIIDYVSFSHQTAGIQSYNRDGTVNRDNVAVATYGGQINTPLMVYGNYLYFGTYNGSRYYYQVDLSNTNTATNTIAYEGSNHFYWAGAYSDGTGVAFGGDGGYLYYTTVANFGASTTTQVYSLNTLGGISDAGNVRSTLCKYGDYVYFTSQGGSGTSYIWKVYWPHISNLTSSDVSKIQLSGGSSTSTPVISANGYIYVGTYGSATYSNNGVRAIPVNNFSANAMFSISSGSGSGKTGTNRAVQSSVIVYSNNSEDYVYFTTNQHTTTNTESGRGFCYKHIIATNACSEVWNSGNGNFTLQGMAAWNGYLTFGNDADTFYVIHAN